MAGATLAMATPMVRFSQAGSAANDVVGVFFVLAAVALLVNARDRRFALALAAVAAGLAVAVKLSMLAPVLALTIGVLAISPGPARRTYWAWWLGPLLLAGGLLVPPKPDRGRKPAPVAEPAGAGDARRCRCRRTPVMRSSTIWATAMC